MLRVQYTDTKIGSQRNAGISTRGIYQCFFCSILRRLQLGNQIKNTNALRLYVMIRLNIYFLVPMEERTKSVPNSVHDIMNFGNIDGGFVG